MKDLKDMLDSLYIAIHELQDEIDNTELERQLKSTTKALSTITNILHETMELGIIISKLEEELEAGHEN